MLCLLNVSISQKQQQGRLEAFFFKYQAMTEGSYPRWPEWEGQLRLGRLHPRVLSLSQGPLMSWFSSRMETAIKAYKP